VTTLIRRLKESNHVSRHRLRFAYAPYVSGTRQQ
jgi:hypothetical protein